MRGLSKIDRRVKPQYRIQETSIGFFNGMYGGETPQRNVRVLSKIYVASKPQYLSQKTSIVIYEMYGEESVISKEGTRLCCERFQ